MKDIMEDAIEYKDKMSAPAVDCSISQKTKERAEETRDAVFDLMLAGKLDRVDIEIIEARNCSPMPSMRAISAKLHIDVANVSRRAQRIKALVIKAVGHND